MPRAWLVALVWLAELLAVVRPHGPAFAVFPQCSQGPRSSTTMAGEAHGRRPVPGHRPAARGLAAREQRWCACPGCYGSSLLSALLSKGGDGRGGEEGGPGIQDGAAADEAGVGVGGKVAEERLDDVSAAMISALQGYKKFISPLLPPSCRFLPTCSAYSMQAIKEFGPSKGVALTAWRLVRCNPFHWGGGGRGYDPPRWPPVEYNHHYP